MRKVLLRWKVSSLGSIEEIGKLLEIAKRIEVIGHLSLGSEGVTQGRALEEISDLNSFKFIEKHEEDDNGILASILCTHPFAKTAIELSNIYVYPPYGIDSERGMEIRMYGLSDSIRRFVGLVKAVMPPDSISVQTFKANGDSDYGFLTEKQKEVLALAVRRGYYDEGSVVTLKQLADEMGIARSTIGEHLKRVESEIMKRAGGDIA
jgi:DNA-binding CsgD family transcriptional regulator